MQRSRYVFLSVPGSPLGDGEAAGETVQWMLVSPNNRPLGRGQDAFATYGAARAAVSRLRERHDLVRPVASAVDTTGQWTWRLELDGETIAVASRSYQRARECQYNLDRFLAAVPIADLVAGTRPVRGARRVNEPAPPPMTVQPRLNRSTR